MTSNIHKLMTISFWSGWLAACGLRMFVRDWFGLERYIEYARSNWIDLHWIVGAAIFTFTVMYYYGKRKEVAFWLKVDTKEGIDYDESDTL